MSERHSGWSTATVAEVAELKVGFPFKSAHYVQGRGVRLLRGDNVIQQDLRWDGAALWHADDLAPFADYLLAEGDVVVAMDRPWIAAGLKVAEVRSEDVPSLLVQRVTRVRARSAVDAKFLCAVLYGEQFTRWLKANDTGTTVPHITKGDIADFEFPLPPLKEQERIAGVLGAFDDLIETNRRLAADLLSLLFARYDLLGRVQPLTTFGNVARRVRDQWKPGSEGPDRYLGLEHFATDGAGLVGVGSTSGVQSVSLRFARGDVLYGKLRPYFRKVARPGFDGLCSSEVWVLRAQEGYPQSLVHALAHSPRFSEVAMAGSSGTRMPRADWKQLSALPVPDLRRSAFSATDLDALEALWSAACELDDESQDLTRQRDELLPLLMSGRVRVREVEAALS